jgi:hypothetical protein
MCQKTEKNKMLTGYYFHRIESGELIWQGKIIDCIEEYVMVQLFSWFDGNPTCCHLVPFTSLGWNNETKEGYMFYEDEETMKHSFEYGEARKYYKGEKSGWHTGL